jgi:hypothetical protein
MFNPSSIAGLPVKLGNAASLGPTVEANYKGETYSFVLLQAIGQRARAEHRKGKTHIVALLQESDVVDKETFRKFLQGVK